MKKDQPKKCKECQFEDGEHSFECSSYVEPDYSMGKDQPKCPLCSKPNPSCHYWSKVGKDQPHILHTSSVHLNKDQLQEPIRLSSWQPIGKPRPITPAGSEMGWEEGLRKDLTGTLLAWDELLESEKDDLVGLFREERIKAVRECMEVVEKEKFTKLEKNEKHEGYQKALEDTSQRLQDLLGKK